MKGVQVAIDDQSYFRRRAEQELELAQRAIDKAVVRAHYCLAEAYLDKLMPPMETGDNGNVADPPVRSAFNFACNSRAHS